MFSIKPLHDYQDLVGDCVQLLNDEWPRSKAARLFSLSKSCTSLPYSLVLVENVDTVVGYCRLAKVISDAGSVLVESVVVDKKRRGQGLGRVVMEKAEQHAAASGYRAMYLCTKDKQGFYQHLGYSYCKPVNTLGALMLETCDCAPETNTPLPEVNGPEDHSLPKCSSSRSPACCATNSEQTSAKDISISIPSNGSTLLTNSAAPPPPAPPPPPPPPPPVASIPVVRIDWMMKSIDGAT